MSYVRAFKVRLNEVFVILSFFILNEAVTVVAWLKFTIVLINHIGRGYYIVV